MVFLGIEQRRGVLYRYRYKAFDTRKSVCHGEPQLDYRRRRTRIARYLNARNIVLRSTHNAFFIDYARCDIPRILSRIRLYGFRIGKSELLAHCSRVFSRCRSARRRSMRHRIFLRYKCRGGGKAAVRRIRVEPVFIELVVFVIHVQVVRKVVRRELDNIHVFYSVIYGVSADIGVVTVIAERRTSAVIQFVELISRRRIGRAARRDCAVFYLYAHAYGTRRAVRIFYFNSELEVLAVCRTQRRYFQSFKSRYSVVADRDTQSRKFFGRNFRKYVVGCGKIYDIHTEERTCRIDIVIEDSIVTVYHDKVVESSGALSRERRPSAVRIRKTVRIDGKRDSVARICNVCSIGTDTP